MKLAVILAAVLGLTTSSVSANMHINASEMKGLWSTWKEINGKVYAESEDVRRFGVFLENYIYVVNFNKENTDVKLALNQFADLTSEEFKSEFINGLLVDESTLLQEENNFLGIDYSVLALPGTIDWRDKGSVTPVKNQAKCGSCWAFSATGALEGLNHVKTGKLLSFSEQQLVDCEKTSHGCKGGLMNNAFAYVAKQGIELETDYPYKAVDQACAYDASKAIKVNKAFKNVPANNPDALKAAIAVQPVAVAIQADQDVFRFYKSGIIKTGCGAGLNHGVLAVGYAKFGEDEAFIVKNSWDTKYGDNGYVKLSTDKKQNRGAGVCGILKMSSYPTA